MARSGTATTGTTNPKKAAAARELSASRIARNTLRSQQYKRAKRSQKAQSIKADFKAAAGDPEAKKLIRARQIELYRTWRPRGAKTVVELEALVKAQQAEIEELRRLAQSGTGASKLEPQGLAEGGEEMSEAEKAEEEEATVATGIKGIDYPVLPMQAEEAGETAQAEEVSEEPAAVANNEDTPLKKSKKSKKEVVRESSADTTAETPRNIRRSPRKRAVKN